MDTRKRSNMEIKNEALRLAQKIQDMGFRGTYDLAAAKVLRDQAAEIERLTGGDADLPEPSLYAHEILRNTGGIWLAVGQKGICEQAHVDGETGEEIKELFTKDQLIDYGSRRAAAMLRSQAAEIERLKSAAKLALNALNEACRRSDRIIDRDYEQAIEALRKAGVE